MPFIVRREDGYQDRDRYTILTLFRPGKAWKALGAAAAVEPQAAGHARRRLRRVVRPGHPAARRLLRHDPDDVPGFEQSYVTALGKGFAVVSTALNNTGHQCNLPQEAESMMMVKERLVEQYGAVRYTIGTGCSGGSIAQHTDRQRLPRASTRGWSPPAPTRTR